MRDVIVIGGGPAGTTAATLLAQRGFSVTLLERERFPRFQIGESLLPFYNDLFARIGVTDQLLDGPFVPKFGAHFVTGDGSLGYRFRFDRRLKDPYRRAFQVKRSEFDHLLLRNAQKHGVDVREETPVTSVDLSNPEKVVVNGDLEARFVVDASGHTALLGTRASGREDVKALKKIAVFSHYRNVPRDEGNDAGNTLIVVLRNAWFWLIPITTDVMSVGLVVDREHFLRCGLQPEEILEKTIADTPFVAERMKAAERVMQVRTRKDFSFRMRNLVGPNYALIGDAAGFLDPIFSTGVFMAMKSADMATGAIESRLRGGSMRALERYEREMNHGLDKYFRFIERFYHREFLELLMQPSERWGLLDAIVGVFAGDIFANRNRFKVGLFFFLVRLQKLFGRIAPPIDWESLPSPAAKLS
jgi:flavin-dependent dehydrogenase